MLCVVLVELFLDCSAYVVGLDSEYEFHRYLIYNAETTAKPCSRKMYGRCLVDRMLFENGAKRLLNESSALSISGQIRR